MVRKEVSNQVKLVTGVLKYVFSALWPTARYRRYALQVHGDVLRALQGLAFFIPDFSANLVCTSIDTR